MEVRLGNTQTASRIIVTERELAALRLATARLAARKGPRFKNIAERVELELAAMAAGQVRARSSACPWRTNS